MSDYNYNHTFKGRSEQICDAREAMSSAPTLEELTEHVLMLSTTLEALLWGLDSITNRK